MQDRDVSEFCNFTVPDPDPAQLPLFCNTTYANSPFGIEPLGGYIPKLFLEFVYPGSSTTINYTLVESSITTESVTYEASSGGTYSITIDSTDNTKNSFTTARGNTYVWNQVSAGSNSTYPYSVQHPSDANVWLQFEADNWFNSGISC